MRQDKTSLLNMRSGKNRILWHVTRISHITDLVQVTWCQNALFESCRSIRPRAPLCNEISK